MEQVSERFDLIRPYFDCEINEAVNRVVIHPWFGEMVAFLFGRDKIEQMACELKNVSSVEEFQYRFSRRAVRSIVEKTAESFTFGGLENLDPSTPYLFVSNHRDIVLDSAIMQWILLENGHRTTQITFGSNLMSSQFVIDIGRINKMFTLFRGGTRIEQYQNALLHSAYIRDAILEQRESVWIAQRDGRTKNGDDRTQAALIKMFSISDREVCPTLEKLNIVPVSVSYEFEPCADSKIFECYVKSQGQQYVKAPGEDFKSVLMGITGWKGRIHMEFGTPLNGFIRKLAAEDLDFNGRTMKIAEEIDRQIHCMYNLCSFNYIAFDRLNDSLQHSGLYYSEEDIRRFETYATEVISRLDGDIAALEALFIRMYAYPLINKQQYV